MREKNFQQQIVDYRGRAGAGTGAGAAILTSWSRSRTKMERLHNTGPMLLGTCLLNPGLFAGVAPAATCL